MEIILKVRMNTHLKTLWPNINIFNGHINFITSIKKVVGIDSQIYYVVDANSSKTLWRIFLYLRWFKTYMHFNIKKNDFFEALESLEDDNLVMTFTVDGNFVSVPPKINDLELAVFSQITKKIIIQNFSFNDIKMVFFILIMFGFLLLPNFNILHYVGIKRYIE